MSSEEIKIYNIEGNIASGKTTLGLGLYSTGKVGFIQEPVKLWRDKFDENLLDLFYSDPKRWSFLFQFAAFATRAKTWKDIMDISDDLVMFVERSIFSDRNVFAKELYLSESMTKTEYQVYCELWDWLYENWCLDVTGTIYVRTPSDICFERIHSRGREEEFEISLDYLNVLEEAHDNWLLNKENVFVLDGSTQTEPEALLRKLGCLEEID